MQCPVRVIVVEGALEVPAALKILDSLHMSENAPAPIDKRGRSVFWGDIHRYNQAAHVAPVFGLADLEGQPCATAVFERYLPSGRHANLVLRLAVRMLESWLLAHAEALATFLKVPRALIPAKPCQARSGTAREANLGEHRAALEVATYPGGPCPRSRTFGRCRQELHRQDE